MGVSGLSDVTAQHRTKPLRVLFFCGEQSPWGYSHLVPLLSEPCIELVGVIIATEERWGIFRKALTGEVQTLPSQFVLLKRLVKTILGRNLTRNALGLLSKYNVPVLFCDDVNSPTNVDSFKEYSADLIFAAAYPQIFKPEVLSVCPEGAFNSHPSLLPRCRGAHPVFWAIASGETKSGATIHLMTHKLDQGDIVAQIAVDVLPTVTYSELYARLVNVIPDLLSQFVTFLVTPGCLPTPQDHKDATCFRNNRQIHHRIFWSEMTAAQIYNLVRASRGKAHFWHGSNRIWVHRTEVADTNRNLTNGVSVPPGTIVDIHDKRPIVATRSGLAVLMSLSLPRLKKVSFEIGQVLE